MPYQASERNFDGVQHEQLRKKIDKKFNDVHDELSDCYYNKKPFRNYGLLTKERFDKLHGLIFLLRDVAFHNQNMSQKPKDRIDEAQYNDITDESGTLIAKKSEQAVIKIAQLKAEGIELVV